MPIYEYRCTSCGKEIEVRQKFSDDPLTECEDCSGALEKMISQSSFVLKGSGWHKTDYPDKGKGPGPTSCDTAGGGKEAKSDACNGCPAATAKTD